MQSIPSSPFLAHPPSTTPHSVVRSGLSQSFVFHGGLVPYTKQLVRTLVQCSLKPRVNGFVREVGDTETALIINRKKRQPGPPGIAHDFCTPGHTTGKHASPKPSVATLHQCLAFLSPSLTRKSSKNHKEMLQNRFYRLSPKRKPIPCPACTTYALLCGLVHGSERHFSVFEKQPYVTLGLSDTFQKILSFLYPDC